MKNEKKGFYQLLNFFAEKILEVGFNNFVYRRSIQVNIHFRLVEFAQNGWKS